MKIVFLVSLIFVVANFGGRSVAESPPRKPSFPPPESVGDWKTIKDRFEKWEIAEFCYAGGIADGGSNGFEFITTNGAKFDLLVVCGSWWTEEDEKKKRQPIFLWHDKKAYRVPQGSKIEARLLLMLNEAATTLEGELFQHPKYVKRLRDVVKSRNIPKYGWPLEFLELEDKDKFGDWSDIDERFKKWEIVEFNEWGLVSDSSKVFWFTASDDSSFGIRVPYIDPWVSQGADPFADNIPKYGASKDPSTLQESEIHGEC